MERAILNFRCTSAFLMKRQHRISVQGSLTPEFGAFQLCFLSALIRPLQDPPAFCLRHSRQDSDHHLPHITVSTDTVVNVSVSDRIAA